jgi:hypothetical protein
MINRFYKNNMDSFYKEQQTVFITFPADAFSILNLFFPVITSFVITAFVNNTQKNRILFNVCLTKHILKNGTIS